MVEHKKILVEVNTPIRTIFLLPSWSVWAESTTRPPPLSPYTCRKTLKKERYIREDPVPDRAVWKGLLRRQLRTCAGGTLLWCGSGARGR